MRIAIVTESWLPAASGVVTRLVNCVPLLGALGHDVTIVTPKAPARAFGAARVIEVPRAELAVARGEVGFIIDSLRADVLHVIKPMHLGWAVALRARRQGRPLVLNLRHWPAGVDFNLFRPQGPVPGPLAEAAATKSIHCLYVGGFDAGAAVGRLLPLARAGGFDLLLVGDGPERATFEALFAGSRSRFHGQMLPCGVARAHALADVLVFPGDAVAEPLAVIEAMASGLPVAAADSPVMRRLLDGYAGGFLFPAGDPDALPATVLNAVRESPDRAALAEAARKRLITWEESTNRLVDLYSIAAGSTAAMAS